MSSEYPYQSSAVKELSRKLASTRSEIAKTSEQIRLTVETVNAETAKLAEFNITVDKISSTVQDASGRVSRLEQTVNGFDFSGFVTFAGLSGGTTSIDGACIKTGTISADRIDVSSLKVATIYTTKYDKIALKSEAENYLHIGGDGSTWNFNYVRIYATQNIIFGSYRSLGTNYGLVVDVTEKTIRPEQNNASANAWSVGSAAYPMIEVCAKTFSAGNSAQRGITIADNQLYPYNVGAKSYCGTESRPFDYGYFSNLYINKTKFDPSSCVTTSTLTDTLKSYATTAALADYAKPGAIYRLYAGGTSTSYYLTYNSSRQLVPSHTGSSYGSSIGTSSSPFYTGYFANLYVNGTAVTPGSYLTSHQSLTDYAKTTAIYRLYAGGTSTTYLLTYNSSRQLVPSHTGSSYGSSIGTSTYPFYWGYFTNLTIQAGTIALGTSAAKLGFFGATAVARKTVAAVSTSGTLANAITGINNLITALKGYGLIS